MLLDQPLLEAEKVIAEVRSIACSDVGHLLDAQRSVKDIPKAVGYELPFKAVPGSG